MFKLVKDLIIIDIETTGINPQTGSIIELGAVIFSKEGYLTDKTFSAYIKPYTSEWTEGAYKVHKIEYSYLQKNGRDLKDVLNSFEIWATNNQFSIDQLKWEYNLAQWSCGFDVSFLSNAYKTINRQFPFYYRAYDISSIVRFELAKRGKLGMKSGENICANELGIKVETNKLHDALYDAQLSGKMLEKLAKESN